MQFLTAFLFLLVTATTSLFAQTTTSGPSVQLYTGYSGNHTNRGMVKFGSDVQYRFDNNLFAGFQASWGFNGNRTLSRNVVWNATYALTAGRTNAISEHFSVQPYIGLGYHISMQTGYIPADPSTQPTDILSRASRKLYTMANDESTETEYAMSRHTAIGVPLGVNFIAHGKNVGLTFGTYVFASKYPEIAFRVGVALGKL